MGFEVGQRVADYEVVSLLGVGGMGRVYRVRNVISHRTEAMKVLLADLQAEPDLAARFVGEIRTLAGLDHPNIAQLHTALQTGNELVMMMEFVDGATLQQLAKLAPLPQEKVIEYMHQVLAALNFAHSHGVVHRDVKPANIMVTPKGTVKLTDFGIAKSKMEHELTRPGTTVGSLYYMSPEQARGGHAVDGRSDIYSVGITLYELLAGRRPFEDESAYVILHSQLHVTPRPPIEINPLLSKPLSDLILRALEKDPSKRFQNAAAMSDALYKVTGIAPAAPVRSSGVFVAPAATNVAGASRMALAAMAAGTARFSTTTQRSSRVAAQSLAVIAVLGSAALGLPHFMKSGALAKTIDRPFARSVAQLPAMPVQAGVRSGDSMQAVLKSPSVAATDSGNGAVEPSSSPVTSQPAIQHSTIAAERVPAVRLSRANYGSAAHTGAALDAEEASSTIAAKGRPVEERQVREQTVELDARAGAVRSSVQRLKSQNEAEGSGLSQYASVAYVRMNAFLDAEKTDLQDGNVAAARDHLNKAEFQASILQNLLSK